MIQYGVRSVSLKRRLCGVRVGKLPWISALIAVSVVVIPSGTQAQQIVGHTVDNLMLTLFAR